MQHFVTQKGIDCHFKITSYIPIYRVATALHERNNNSQRGIIYND